MQPREGDRAHPARHERPREAIPDQKPAYPVGAMPPPLVEAAEHAERYQGGAHEYEPRDYAVHPGIVAARSVRVQSLTGIRLEATGMMEAMNAEAGAPQDPSPELVKVWYRFVPREGWLPYDTEGLWAVRLGKDTARVANAPFLQDGVARARLSGSPPMLEGLHWAVERVEVSGNCTVRVVPIPRRAVGAERAGRFEQLAPLGLGGEAYSREFPLVALTAPAGADFAGIKALLFPRAAGELVAFRGLMRHGGVDRRIGGRRADRAGAQVGAFPATADRSSHGGRQPRPTRKNRASITCSKGLPHAVCRPEGRWPTRVNFEFTAAMRARRMAENSSLVTFWKSCSVSGASKPMSFQDPMPPNTHPA